MMMDPNQYVEQYKNTSYLEILNFRNELIKSIEEFEHDFARKKPDWKIAPTPDVQYQWNLKTLGFVASMLSEAFNREYEYGEKDMYDYAEDMRKVYVE